MGQANQMPYLNRHRGTGDTFLGTVSIGRTSRPRSWSNPGDVPLLTPTRRRQDQGIKVEP